MKLLLIVLIGILALSVSTSYLVFAQSQTVQGVVFFMKSNSNATIVMKYTLHYSLNGTTNNTMKLYGTSDNDFFNPNLSGITITTNPQHSSLEKGSRLVTYTITATDNVKGIYNIPLNFCGTTLFSIGLNESQLDPAILYKYFTARYSCPAFTIYSPDREIVNMTGIISKIITIDQNKISPLKQFKSGITFENIICKQGFVKVMKLTDYSPACVNSQTAEKLIAHYWGINSKDIKTKISMMVVRWNSTSDTEQPIIHAVDYGVLAKYPILRNAMDQADQQFNAGLLPICGNFERWWNIAGPVGINKIPCLHFSLPLYMAKQMITDPQMTFNITDNGNSYETYINTGVAKYRIWFAMR